MKEFEKIIGYEGVKQELRRISDVLLNMEAYRKLGVTLPGGLLLHGEPGVGKTLMATVLIAASRRKAFVIRKDRPNGDFIKAIKETFAEAKAAAPSIVFLDDMDKFSNGDERHPDEEEYVTVQSCIDEIAGSEVFVLATANSIRTLPRSLLRAGRFDRIIKINTPCRKDAVKIIDHYMKQKKFVNGLNPETVCRMMSGCSCAKLEAVINEAGLYAGFERSAEITMEHFMKACLECVHMVPNEVLNSALPDTDLLNGGDQRARIVCHEAGHATVAEVLNAGGVTLVSAYSRSGQSGGFTLYHAEDDTLPKDVYGHICRSLGGMAAIEQRFGVIDLGTTNDLDQAFRAVWDLVTNQCVCGFGLHANGFGFEDDSTELKTKQEQAVSAEVERLYRKTKEILSANYELFERIAAELNRKGVITGADIQRIRQNCRVIPVHV